jgi:hypothetical protein
LFELFKLLFFILKGFMFWYFIFVDLRFVNVKCRNEIIFRNVNFEVIGFYYLFIGFLVRFVIFCLRVGF